MHIIITGGSRGIGAAAVRLFSARGDRVDFIYRHRDADAQALAKAAGAAAHRCDLSSAEETTALFSKLEPADVLVCCAGISLQGLIQDTSEEDWDSLFDHNVKSVFHAVKGVLPGMLHVHSGCIVTVASMWGETGASCESVYAATKGAVIALTKSLARELAPSHIRVNAVSPGAIKTEMLSCYSDAELEALRTDTPLEALGTPEDVAQAIAYLADAPFVTGQILGVNGGFVI